jgi:hypothetical protein
VQLRDAGKIREAGAKLREAEGLHRRVDSLQLRLTQASTRARHDEWAHSTSMLIPPLYSATMPFFPQWAPPNIGRPELSQLGRRLVVIVGVDQTEDVYKILGTGYIINVLNNLQILTASHVIQEFVNQVIDRPRSAFYGLDPRKIGRRFRVEPTPYCSDV